MTSLESSPVQTSRASRFSMNSALGVSLIAIVLAAAFVVTGVASMISSVFAPGTGSADPSKEVAKLASQHQEQMKTWQDRFNGRSAFYKPPAPPPPPRNDPPPKVVVKPPDPGPPPTPTKYEGPSVVFAMSDFVRFKPPSSNEKQLDIGVGEEKSGVKVISTEGLPWTVKLGYKGGEYVVPIFQRGNDDKHLLAQAPPMIIIPSLVEVPAAKLEIQTPKSSGEAEAAAVVKQAPTAQGRNRATVKTETPAPQSPPAREQRDQRRGGDAKEASDADHAAADADAQDEGEQQHPEHAATQPQKDDGSTPAREPRSRRGREPRSSPRRPGSQ